MFPTDYELFQQLREQTPADQETVELEYICKALDSCDWYIDLTRLKRVAMEAETRYKTTRAAVEHKILAHSVTVQDGVDLLLASSHNLTSNHAYSAATMHAISDPVYGRMQVLKKMIARRELDDAFIRETKLKEG